MLAIPTTGPMEMGFGQSPRMSTSTRRAVTYVGPVPGMRHRALNDCNRGAKRTLI